ncbi:MAG: T9SS type A sorting domain-containing protein [Bacteroidota bacterium]
MLFIWTQIVQGQIQIIPDTLDNRRYYPLEVGNEWQIVENAFASAISTFRRTRITGDTLVAGRQYFKSKFELYDLSKILSYERETWLRYNDVGAVLSFNSITEDSLAVDSTLYWYHADFKDSVDVGLLNRAFVSGRYDTTITFPGPVHVPVSAVKELIVPDPITGTQYGFQQAYAADLGLIRYAYWDGPDGYLAFARIGDMTYGERIIQEEHSVNPESWFPLEVGNYWHYQYDIGGGFLVDDIKQATKDTLIDNLSWVAIQNVECDPAPQFCPSHEFWYRFTDDHYLTRSIKPGVAKIDTIAATYPESIFLDTITHKRDTLQYALGQGNIVINVIENPNGNPQDSTHWQITAQNTPNELLIWKYIYKIGEANGLIGAIVGNLVYGNVTRIDEIIRVSIDQEPAHKPQLLLNAYPNPVSSALVVQTSMPGVIEVFDALGRQIDNLEVVNPGIHRLDVSKYAPGLYLLRQGSQLLQVIVQ